jgi:hypothetical protein
MLYSAFREENRLLAKKSLKNGLQIKVLAY